MSQANPVRFSWTNATAYATLLVIGLGLVVFICRIGATFVSTPPSVALTTHAVAQVDVILHVMATLAAVILLGTVLGRVCRWMGQPPVIGEVLAGIILGPSVLGAISPELMHLLIPSAATDPKGLVPTGLKAVSQIGVVLYMFLVGLELNAALLRNKVHSAIAVSHASIVLPFVLGTTLALGSYQAFAPEGVPFTHFALFMGVAMSITAFPVLARILTDRRIEKTELGIIALGCAAADDVTAWCLLALIVAIAQSQVSGIAILGIQVGVFLAVMLLVVRPLVVRWNSRMNETKDPLPSIVMAGIFVAVLASAMITEAIGIHALFGAFLLGAIIPHDGKIAREFTAKLKDPVTVLLLPAFFAFTGMRTQLGLLSAPSDWLWCGLIILVATAGKLGGATLAARLTGQSWHDSIALGALMNTRGLMELIVLNIGLDMGVISPRLFAMMVIMALVTTAATCPILSLIEARKKQLIPVAELAKSSV